MLIISSCYPINTVLVDQKKLNDYLAAHPNALDSSDDSDSSDDGGSSSSVIFFHYSFKLSSVTPLHLFFSNRNRVNLAVNPHQMTNTKIQDVVFVLKLHSQISLRNRRSLLNASPARIKVWKIFFSSFSKLNIKTDFYVCSTSVMH